MDETGSQEKAFSLLSKYRAYLITRARYEAVLTAIEEGEVDSRQVRERLRTLGVLHPDIDERWLGTVFPGKGLFEWTGRRREVHDASPRQRPEGGGGRPIRVWRLKKGAKISGMPAWEGPDVSKMRFKLPEPPAPESMRAVLRNLEDPDAYGYLRKSEMTQMEYGGFTAWLRDVLSYLEARDAK